MLAAKLRQHAPAIAHEAGEGLTRRQTGFEQQHQEVNEHRDLGLDPTHAAFGDAAQDHAGQQETQHQCHRDQKHQESRLVHLFRSEHPTRHRQSQHHDGRDQLRRVIDGAYALSAPARLDEQTPAFAVGIEGRFDLAAAFGDGFEDLAAKSVLARGLRAFGRQAPLHARGIACGPDQVDDREDRRTAEHDRGRHQRCEQGRSHQPLSSVEAIIR
jgi:hypothetical protein